MKPTDSVSTIKGIGVSKAKLLQKLGIETVGDFLTFYPREYQDKRNIEKIANAPTGTLLLIRARVALIVKERYMNGSKQRLRLLVEDESGSLEIVFFNARYLVNYFKQGAYYDFYGKISVSYGKRSMLHPEFSEAETAEAGSIVPIYPLTAGIGQLQMKRWQRMASAAIDEMEECLSEEIISSMNLCSRAYALKNIHFPEDVRKLKEARYRLIFEELFFLQTGLMSIKSRLGDKKKAIAFDRNVDIAEFSGSFRYKLTGAQERVISEIMADMEDSRQMNRLVQGDVGSGKTAVAEVALYKAVKSGYQGAMMAPTEILARQHYKSFCEDFQGFGIRIGFVSGGMGLSERKKTLEALKKGEIDILVGTHAVISDGVEFKRLGLVITDEQHRFGVNQRALLSAKGENPDVLVMTATPIPRTLAVVLYGDLDISAIDELPPGRQKIITKSVNEKGRAAAYEFLRGEIVKGRQGYIVAPLIEDSESIEARSAESLFSEISKRFSGCKVALLHGAMGKSEKDEIMQSFYRGETDILVSTVVIEVGINVPNATVMLIENAERFGLAQLHQLRGRVGRGEHQSYCILVTEGSSKVARERAKIMAETDSGFVIAEKDLELRGPGEFFGTKQHGIPSLKLADLTRHTVVLQEANRQARKLLLEDPHLEKPENACIKRRLLQDFSEVNI